MQRYLAFALVLLPIMFSVLGVKLIRDYFFLTLHYPLPNLFTQFIIGCITLLVGLYIIGKFILYRDKKRNKVQSRFK